MPIIDKGAIVAYLFAAITIILFLRLLSIRIRVIRYIKKYHRDYWENNIHLFLTGSRASISQLTKGLHDPKIEDFKKEDIRSLKQLLVSVLVMSFLLVVFIYFRLI